MIKLWIPTAASRTVEARQLAGFRYAVSEEGQQRRTGYSRLATGGRLLAFAIPWSIRCTFAPEHPGEGLGHQAAGRLDHVKALRRLNKHVMVAGIKGVASHASLPSA